MRVGDLLQGGEGLDAYVAAGGAPTSVDNTAIYYLRTTDFPANETRLTGPFVTMPALAKAMFDTFGSECTPGREAMLEKFVTGQLGRVEHVISPINNDRIKTRTNMVVKETNANVRARLPGPAYTVMSMDVHTELADNMTDGRIPLKAYNLHKTFVTKSAALAKATQVAQTMASQRPGTQVVQVPEGLLAGASQAEVKLISVQFPPIGEAEMTNVAVYYTDWTGLHAASEQQMAVPT